MALSSAPQRPPETLSDLIQDLWRIRFFIFIGAVTGFIVAGLYVVMAQSSYKVSMVVGAVPSISTQVRVESPSLSPLTPQQSDNVNTLSQMNQNMYLTLFRSPRVASMITKMPDQLAAISQDKRYGLFSYQPKYWADQDLARYFQKDIRITPVQNTNDLIEISYTHPNPDFARSFLLQLHALTDESIRNDHKKLVNDRRAYITKALGASLNLDHKKALGQLLIDLEREAIMVNSDRSFAMRIINPPASSASPSYPNKSMLFLAFIFAGSFLGTFIGFSRPS